jgi:hypothetical protein
MKNYKKRQKIITFFDILFLSSFKFKSSTTKNLQNEDQIFPETFHFFHIETFIFITEIKNFKSSLK